MAEVRKRWTQQQQTEKHDELYKLTLKKETRESERIKKKKKKEGKNR